MEAVPSGGDVQGFYEPAGDHVRVEVGVQDAA